MPRFIAAIDVTRWREGGNYIVNGWIEAPNLKAAQNIAWNARQRNARVWVIPWEQGDEEMWRVAEEKGQIVAP